MVTTNSRQMTTGKAFEYALLSQFEEKLKDKTNVEVINKDGKVVGRVKTIEDKGKKLTELIKGKEAALSVEKLTLGRGADGGDFLITNMSESAFRKLKNKKHLLSKSEVEVLKELAEIKRKENDLWGI